MATVITFRQNCSKVQFLRFSLRKKCWFLRRSWEPFTADPFITSIYLTLMLPEKLTSRMLTLVPSATTKYWVKLLALVLSLCAYSNSIRNCTWLYCEVIPLPSKEPWNHLFLHGDHLSFLLMTGLTREAFDMLHNILKPPGHPSLPKRRGRKWSLTSEGQLGLFLFYICSTLNYKYLCLIFGVTPNACSRILRNMLKLVVWRLRFPRLQITVKLLSNYCLLSKLLSLGQ